MALLIKYNIYFLWMFHPGKVNNEETDEKLQANFYRCR